MITLAVILIILGLVLYFANVFLIRHYIEKKIPGLLEIDELLPKLPKNREYLWERTADAGIVPRWISVMGLLSYPLLIVGAAILVSALLFKKP